MKKEVKYFLLGMGSVVAVILLAIGGLFIFYQFQGNNSNSNNNELNETDNKKIVCDVLNNVKQGDYSGFITNDNKLYVLDTSKKYSNNSNCMQISDTEIISRIGYDYCNDKMCFSLTDNKLKEWDTRNIEVNQVFINKDIIKANHGPNITSGTNYLVLKTDGKLYENNYKSNYENNFAYKEVSSTLYKSFDNEKIIDFKIATDEYDIANNYIKTDKAFYTSDATNKKECEEYADIKCKYELKKNDVLTKNYNDISYISSSDISTITVIMKDGTIKELRR